MDYNDKLVAASHLTTVSAVTSSVLSSDATLITRSPQLAKIPRPRSPDRIIAANPLGTQQIFRLLGPGGANYGEVPLTPGEQVVIDNASSIEAVFGADTVLLRLFWFHKPGELLLP